MSLEEKLKKSFVSKVSVEEQKQEPVKREGQSSSGTSVSPTPPPSTATYMGVLEGMRGRYTWDDMDTKRRKRRMSFEFFDEHGEVVGSIARQLSAELNENLSASHLLRKWVEEGIRKAEKDLESLKKLK